MNRSIALIYGVICYGIFFLTFLYLIGFMSNMFVPKSIDVGQAASTGEAFLINVGLIALFGVQHSVMARPAFKERWTKIVPHVIERSTYVLLSSLVLILMFWQWRPMPASIWNVQSDLAQGLLWAAFLAGFLLVLLSTFIISHFDLFGLRQVWLNLKQQSYQPNGFRITYFYKFVRHPIYLGFIIAFWATPTMTVGHLLFAMGMTAYMLIGIRYEERDLVRFIGDDYANYRSAVPMLVPGLNKGHATVQATEVI